MECRTQRIRYAVADGFHALSWTHWGSPALEQRAICVHGLTRTGRDFDTLARHLVLHGWQVACPDLPGRGLSDWLHDPALYAAPTYATALSHLLAALGWRDCAWVGTSLGGIVGMAIAGLPGTPVRRLVLNDIGAEIPRAAIARIAAYLGKVAHFPDLGALEAHLRQVHAPFGPLSDAEWAHLARHSARPAPQGGLALHYDPAIAQAFATPDDGATADGPVDLWPLWQRVACPVLLLRGETSDVLMADTAARMAARPGTELATIAGCGHAPALMEFGQVSRVAAFLDG